MMTLNNIEVGYGEMQVLFGVSLEVNEKEIVALIGSNGAGKTTTLSAISGMARPRNGQITFCGERIDRLSPHKIVQLGIAQVPEGRRIFHSLTVLENLEIGAFIKKSKAEREKTLDFVLELFPVLKARGGQRGGTLSGGEQQMLAIGRALMANPRILMLDEPSLGLAPLVVDEIYRIIESLNASGVTILLVEQNVVQALELSHRAYVYENGRVFLQGPSQELLKNPDIKRAYIGMD
ncbi:MAG: ABC transporter ATP-binding protein [Deltaproteobacteria bacterium]|nr:ABC transporter ATP-binding protein [Deltaproteobacteria bacterium]